MEEIKVYIHTAFIVDILIILILSMIRLFLSWKQVCIYI